MHKARFFLYLVLALIPFGRLLDLPVLESVGKTASISPIEVSLFLAILCYGWSKLSRSQWRAEFVHGFQPVLWFSLWSLFSLLLGKIRFGLSLSEMAFSGLYLGRWVAYSFLYLITYEIVANKYGARKVLKWLIAGGVAFAAFGIFQVIFLPPDFALVLHPEARAFTDFDPQGHRLVSTFLDPNIAAGFLLIPALIAMSFYIHGYKHWRLATILLIVALVATLSRGGALGFVIGVLYLLFSSKAYRRTAAKVLAGMLLVLLVSYPFLKDALASFDKLTFSDQSSYLRLYQWALALEAVRENWLTGIGFNTFGYVWRDYGRAKEGAAAFGMENDLIMILMLTGIIGFALYLWMYRGMLRPLSMLGRSSTSTWDIAFGRGVWAATIAVIVSSLFTTLILYPHIMATLWILWALGRRLQECAQPPAISLPVPVAVGQS